MASGSSDRVNSGSKGFDFGSDDILCSYEDYANQNSSNGPHSLDQGIGAANSSKEFNKTRMARSSIFPSSSYSPPEDSFSQDITSLVERTMKKYADNMMRFLEGISSRLSQLELYCYNLDKTIGEMRSDLTRDHGDSDTKLKSIEKHLQEVRRSVQVLRDKQELAETQKELAKLQLVHKDSNSSTQSHSNDERASTPAPATQKPDNSSDGQNQQLALALPHQVAPQPQPAPPQAIPQQPSSYYMSHPNPPAANPSPASTGTPHPPAPGQGQYIPAQQASTGTPHPPPPGQGQYIPAQQAQSHVSLAPPAQSFSQYQQVWPQQMPQQVQPQQQPSMPPPQVRPQPTSGQYPSYTHTQQPINQPSPPETIPSSMPMQVPYSGGSQQSLQSYGYGAPPSRIPQQGPLPPQIKSSTYGAQLGDGYAGSESHPIPPSGYTMYDGSEAGRTHYPTQQSQFPPTGYGSQQPQGGSNPPGRNPGGPPPVMRNQPYGDLIDKLVNMGFRGDHVMSVIQRMEETGQPIDFNSVLDRLNVQSSGGPQRGW